MATNNGTKEILSLYRLEFYKKKNHWKLSKEYETSGTTNKLNETYCISVDQCSEVQPSDGRHVQHKQFTEKLLHIDSEAEYINSETLYPQSTANAPERAARDTCWECGHTRPSCPDDNGYLQNPYAGEADSSFEEFLSGARLAPHSSEWDLTRHSVGPAARLRGPLPMDTHTGRGRGRLARLRDPAGGTHGGRPQRE